VFSSIKSLLKRIFAGCYIHRVWKFLVSVGCTIARVRKFLVSTGCTIARVRKFLVFVGCTIARVRKFLVSAGFTIARVQQFLYMGKTSVFLMLLEGEASMVRWPLNGLDLTHFHDLVGTS
jgi:hypothetical protein